VPIYTYRCKNCGVQFDRHQNIDGKPLTRCPECGKDELRKVFLPVGIVFKGSGFYATDHRSPSGQRTGQKTEKKSTTDEKSDRKTETEDSTTSEEKTKD
jgi:putative FmdB family regulatory protein